VLVHGDEITTVTSFWHAFGLSPADQSAQAEKQSFNYNQDKGFMDRTTRLENDYIKALKAGASATEVG
jgi:hypothetical protein